MERNMTDNKKDNSKDRRIRKTRKAVHAALLELLQEKKFADITIIELAERADINRKTFYNHYTDLNEVLEEIEEDLADSMILTIKEKLPKIHADHEIHYEDMQEVVQECAYPFFFTNIEQLRENPIYIKLLTSPKIEHSFSHILMQKETELFMEYFGRHIENPLWLRYFLQFIVNGSIAVLKDWSKEDYPISTEEMARFFSILFQGNNRLFDFLCESSLDSDGPEQSVSMLLTP